MSEFFIGDVNVDGRVGAAFGHLKKFAIAVPAVPGE